MPRHIKGRMDGRTDRPYFIGPFRLLPGIQKRENNHGGVLLLVELQAEVYIRLIYKMLCSPLQL